MKYERNKHGAQFDRNLTINVNNGSFCNEKIFITSDFFKLLQEKSGMSTRSLAKEIGVRMRTVEYWRSKDSYIAKALVDKIRKLSIL